MGVVVFIVKQPTLCHVDVHRVFYFEKGPDALDPVWLPVWMDQSASADSLIIGADIQHFVWLSSPCMSVSNVNYSLIIEQMLLKV